MSAVGQRRSRVRGPLVVALVASGLVVPGGSVAAPVELRSCSVAPDGAANTVTVWHQLGFLAEEQLGVLIDEFEAARPGVTVEAVDVGADGGLLQALRSDRPAPDVLLVNAEAIVNITDSGRVTPAAACIAEDPSFDQDDLLPAVVAALSVDDTLYALPMLMSTPVVYFDQAQFRAAGLDPADAPDDMDELVGQLRTLVSSGQVQTGMVTASAEWFVLAWAADLGLELADDSGRVALGARELDVLQEPLLERLEGISTMGAERLIDDIGNEGFEDLLKLTDPVRPAGMVPHTSGSMGVVYDLLADGRFENSELGVFPFPFTERGTVVGGPVSFMFAEDPGQQALAWSFMAHLASPASQARAATLGYVGARRSSLEDPVVQAAWRDRPGLRVPNEVVAAIDGSRPGSVSVAAGPDYRLEWRLGWAVRDIIDGSSPRDSLARAEIDIELALDAYAEARARAAAP
jgi:sn-glycerol 3-phosphate transport system substrate-binding protein